MSAHLVKARDPEGGEAFLCYKAPGLTPRREEATRFANARAAGYAAHAARWGPSDAFWESERESARRTAEARKGWTFTVEETR